MNDAILDPPDKCNLPLNMEQKNHLVKSYINLQHIKKTTEYNKVVVFKLLCLGVMGYAAGVGEIVKYVRCLPYTQPT